MPYTMGMKSRQQPSTMTRSWCRQCCARLYLEAPLPVNFPNFSFGDMANFSAPEFRKENMFRVSGVPALSVRARPMCSSHSFQADDDCQVNDLNKLVPIKSREGSFSFSTHHHFSNQLSLAESVYALGGLPLHCSVL